ncbi:hypothetical protein J5X84_22455 [Streptosporangiaceae bacterium NEAU-GS5]|nr:hypothetical protein [Streptosporangiaceae bacterium NEAU-GS5]
MSTIAGVAAVAVGLAVFASALASGLASSGGPGSDGGPAPGVDNPVPKPLRDQLAVKVRTILERASPTEHHQHGHNFGDKPYPVVCAVEPFGIDPPEATTIKQVHWVYAQYMCAVDDFGGPWNASVRASGPLAVELTVPPDVVVPKSGPGYQDHIRQIIPARYHQLALGFFTDPSVIDEARKRFEELPQQR